jgi:tetratricopeptide (TPR) repeat protein
MQMMNMIRRIPVQVALGALIFYLMTLGHGVTINSLSLTAKLAGWDWTPMVGQPVLWLLTLPLRLLPEAWVAVGLNIFSAVTAALTLGLLVRTVQLMPWDWPWPAQNRLAAALPVLLACGLCGLEFNFWQEATAATGEMLDLLLLAVALWLLLEYRVSRNSRWLDAAALVWGLGMAENWVMQLTLPLFIAGIIWLEGMAFFRRKFVLRLAGLGLAGFAVYAVLPLANGLVPHSPLTFGESWLGGLKQTKNTVLALYYQFWRAHRILSVAVALYFLVPLLSCLVRLRDEGTANKYWVDSFQIWLYRCFRIVLLLGCVWLAFDPTTGLRQIIKNQSGISLMLLTFDYINALGAAYLAGNLLLISVRLVSPSGYRSPKIPLRRLVIPMAAGFLVLVTAGLMSRNYGAIARMNFHPLERFGELGVKSLPVGGGVVLSDQPQKLTVFQAALAHHPDAPTWLAVDTRLLPKAIYRDRLERRQPGNWLTGTNQNDLTSLEVIRLLEQLARTNRLFYLHYNSGLLFERFYQEPAGAVYEIKLRGRNPLETPLLSAAAMATNEAFWTQVWREDLASLVPPPARRLTGLSKRMQRLGYTPAPRNQDRLLAEWGSISLDGWGVALQQQGHWTNAQLRLEQAMQLNNNNFSARMSLACNTNFQAGGKLGLSGLERAATEVGSLQRLNLLMQIGGPVDEPVFCFLLGYGMQQIGLPIQAVEQFERARTLAPGSLVPDLALAEIYTRFQSADRALPLIRRLQDNSKKLPATNTMDVQLALLETDCWLSQSNVINAQSALQTVAQRHSGDPEVMSRIAGAYLAFRDYTNAMRLVETQLAKMPDDVPSLNLKAAILFQSGNVTSAIPVLNHILTLTNLPSIRLNRAIARMASQDLAGAEREYRELEMAGEELGPASYGLAKIAGERKDTNQEVHYLRISLTNSVPGSLIWQQIRSRLQTLEPPTENKF